MNFSISQLFRAYARNRDLISAHIRGQPVEQNSNDSTKTILGMTLGVFLAITIFYSVIWIWLLVLTLERWQRLPEWAKVMAVLCLLPVLPMGPFIGLITVYIASAKSKKSK